MMTQRDNHRGGAWQHDHVGLEHDVDGEHVYDGHHDNDDHEHHEQPWRCLATWP